MKIESAEKAPQAHEPLIPLPEDVPVTMPKLPVYVTIRTLEQLKAIADPVRSRMLGIIQNEPATAKQLADRLHIAPGSAGHHLQVLEEAGLAKVSALRLVRGIVAKYYTRTARIFAYDLPPDVAGEMSSALEILNHARDEMVEAVGDYGENAAVTDGLARARLSPAQAHAFRARVDALFEEFAGQPPDPDGEIYSLYVGLFHSPAYLQHTDSPPVADEDEADGA